MGIGMSGHVGQPQRHGRSRSLHFWGTPPEPRCRDDGSGWRVFENSPAMIFFRLVDGLIWMVNINGSSLMFFFVDHRWIGLDWFSTSNIEMGWWFLFAMTKRLIPEARNPSGSLGQAECCYLAAVPSSLYTLFDKNIIWDCPIKSKEIVLPVFFLIVPGPTTMHQSLSFSPDSEEPLHQKFIGTRPTAKEVTENALVPGRSTVKHVVSSC